MSATWSIAKGRFDRFLACSSVPASRSTAQLLIGTRPGLLTRGSLMVTSVRSTAEAASTDVDVSVSVSDDMAPDLRPALTVADCPPGVEARQNEDRPLASGTGRRWSARGTGLSPAHPPTVDPVPEPRGHDQPTDRQRGRSGGGCSSLLLRHLGSSLIYIPRRPSRRR